jgi:5-methylcytosine-specific restriction endonuclease McrA
MFVELISNAHPRTVAKQNGDAFYNTGVLCSKGHSSDRYTTSGQCVTCHAAYYKTDDQKQKQAEYRKKTVTQKAVYDKEFNKNNKEYRAALKSANRAKRKQRIATWDKEFTDFVFEEAYHLCKLRESVTGFKWHVDHVIPLSGKTVSGLHIWNNLAVIPAKENLRKKNSYTME